MKTPLHVLNLNICTLVDVLSTTLFVRDYRDALQDGDTALYGAMLRGNVEMVQLLVGAGANLETMGKVTLLCCFLWRALCSSSWKSMFELCY
jgi:ankyrin repeat protein